MADTPEPTDSHPTTPKMIPPPPYSHGVTVAAITSVYEMVKRVHADTSKLGWDLEYPPPGGWPMLTYELFKGSKTHAAVEFMRSIPYFRDECGHEPVRASPGAPYIMDSTWLINYASPDWVSYYTERYPGWELEEKKWDTYGGTCTLPPHMVRLTHCTRDGCDVVVDTQAGLVLWQHCGGDRLSWVDWTKLKYGPESYDEHGQILALRGAPRFEVQDFAEICKEAFVKMYWMPKMEEGDFRVCHWNGVGSPDEDDALRMQIMTSAGWPGEGWDKAKAEREMKEAEKEMNQAEREIDDES